MTPCDFCGLECSLATKSMGKAFDDDSMAWLAGEAYKWCRKKCKQKHYIKLGASFCKCEAC